MPVTELAVGDVIAVRPGELIGADGRVVAGRSDVDQASVTGESLLVPAGSGDEVFAGTTNGTGALRVRVGRPAADSVIARIAAMVQQASATKAPTQLFIERVEQRTRSAWWWRLWPCSSCRWRSGRRYRRRCCAR